MNGFRESRGGSVGDEAIRALIREAEQDPSLWRQAALELIRAGRLDEGGRAAARVSDLVERAALLDAVVPSLDALEERVEPFQGGLERVVSAAWSPDERTLYVGGPGRVVAQSVADGKILQTFSRASQVAVSPRGDAIALGPPFSVMDLATGAKEAFSPAPYDRIAFSPDGDGVLASIGGAIQAFRRDGTGELSRLVGQRPLEGTLHHLDTTGAFVSADGDRLILHDPATAAPRMSIDLRLHARVSKEISSLPAEAVGEILGAWREWRFIVAMKAYRAATGLGLKEAKEAVDSIETWQTPRALGSRVLVTTPRETLLLDHTGAIKARGRLEVRGAVPAPSGRHLASVTFAEDEHGDFTGPPSLLLRDLGTGAARRFEGIGGLPVWSPSGRRLAAIERHRVTFLEPPPSEL
jgi:hypothetical protein